MRAINIIRWILLVPVFFLVNTFGQYYYMEFVNHQLARRISIMGDDHVFILSKMHHALILIALALLVLAYNCVFAWFSPKVRVGVLVLFILSSASLVYRYASFGIHFTWEEFYYFMGVVAMWYSMASMSQQDAEVKTNDTQKV